MANRIRFNPDTAGRPVLIKGKTQLLFRGMGRLSENCVLNIKNKSHSVTAEIDVPASFAEEVESFIRSGGFDYLILSQRVPQEPHESRFIFQHKDFLAGMCRHADKTGSADQKYTRTTEKPLPRKEGKCVPVH